MKKFLGLCLMFWLVATPILADDDQVTWFGDVAFVGEPSEVDTQRCEIQTVDPELDLALLLANSSPVLGDQLAAPSCRANDLKLTWPLRGTNGRHWMIGNYLDLAPVSGSTRDYRGRRGSLARTYDGHNGVDVGIPSFRQMDDGSAKVRAAAAGLVTFVRSNQPDRNLVSLAGCNLTWNVVTVRHDNGFSTVYGHLKRGSVSVKVGDWVATGAVLGVVGSSGCSTHPHLHFELRDCSNQRLETFNLGSWKQPPVYNPASNVMDVMLRAGGAPSTRQIQDPAPNPVFKPNSTLGIGLSLTARSGDRIGFVLRQPNGRQYRAWTWTVGGNARYRHIFPRWSTTLGSKVGRWWLEVRVNSRLRAVRIVGVSTLRPGAREVARHGVGAGSYQWVFNDIIGAGYRLVWIDGYRVNGKNYFNAIFRPEDGTIWTARHGLTASQYQAEFDLRVARGYRPLQVESYPAAGGIRYAVIFEKKAGPAWRTYHGKTASQQQSLFNSLTASGYRPINISVVSLNGSRRYTAFYEKKGIGSWQAKSFLTTSQYQTAFNDNVARGRKLIYLNAYGHKGSPRFTAIWSSSPRGQWTARHHLTSSRYQTTWNEQTAKGLSTRLVTGYPLGKRTRFAAMWRK